MELKYDITDKYLCLSVMYDSMINIYENMPISKDEFISKMVNTYNIIGFYDKYVIGGVAYDNSGNCHIAISDEYQGRCGFMILKAMNYILSITGLIKTDTLKCNTKANNMLKKLGFLISDENQHRFYWVKYNV